MTKGLINIDKLISNKNHCCDHSNLGLLLVGIQILMHSIKSFSYKGQRKVIMCLRVCVIENSQDFGVHEFVDGSCSV